MVAPNDLVIVVVFTISGEEFSGNIHICISYLTLEPIKEKLASGFLRDVELENTWLSQLQTLLMETQVNVTAELGRNRTHTVGDLLNINKGDVIKLLVGPQDPVVVTVEEVPKYQGFPGVVKGNRAVQITSLIQREGGTGNDGYR
jgi:flagellar motor switch protein FliM